MSVGVVALFLSFRMVVDDGVMVLCFCGFDYGFAFYGVPVWSV